MSPFDPRRSAAAAVDQAVSRRTSDPRGCLLPERRLSPHHHPARPQMACASLDEFLQMEGMERRKTTAQDVSRSDYTQCFIHYNLLYLQDLELERALGENEGSDIPTGQPPAARGAGYMSPPASPSRAAAAAAAGSPQRSIINQQVRRGAGVGWGGARRVLPVSESHH